MKLSLSNASMMKQIVGFVILFILCSPIYAQRDYTLLDNPSPTQYMIGGTAFQLKGGEFLYKNTLLLVNTLSYGLTDHLTLGAGTELYTTISGESVDRLPNLYFVNVKAGCSLAKNLRASAGYEFFLFRGRMLRDDSNDRIPVISLAYSMLTYGSAANNLTLGVYLPTVNWVKNLYDPAYQLGGMFRIGRSASIVAEAWMPFAQRQVLVGGFRFFGRKSAIDLGLAYLVGYTFPAPILDYSLTF